MAPVVTFICLVIYLAGLAIAAVRDLTSLTIPNRVAAAVAAAAAGGVLSAVPDPAGWGAYFAVGLAVLAAGAVLFFLGLWGAGDAKLLAAASLAAGFDGLPVLALWTALCGGLLAVVLLVLRRLRPPWCRHLTAGSGGVPYGVAIAAGAVIAVIGRHTILTDRFMNS